MCRNLLPYNTLRVSSRVAMRVGSVLARRLRYVGLNGRPRLDFGAGTLYNLSTYTAEEKAYRITVNGLRRIDKRV